MSNRKIKIILYLAITLFTGSLYAQGFSNDKLPAVPNNNNTNQQQPGTPAQNQGNIQYGQLLPNGQQNQNVNNANAATRTNIQYGGLPNTNATSITRTPTNQTSAQRREAGKAEVKGKLGDALNRSQAVTSGQPGVIPAVGNSIPRGQNNPMLNQNQTLPKRPAGYQTQAITPPVTNNNSSSNASTSKRNPMLNQNQGLPKRPAGYQTQAITPPVTNNNSSSNASTSKRKPMLNQNHALPQRPAGYQTQAITPSVSNNNTRNPGVGSSPSASKYKVMGPEQMKAAMKKQQQSTSSNVGSVKSPPNAAKFNSPPVKAPRSSAPNVSNPNPKSQYGAFPGNATNAKRNHQYGGAPKLNSNNNSTPRNNVVPRSNSAKSAVVPGKSANPRKPNANLMNELKNKQAQRGASNSTVKYAPRTNAPAQSNTRQSAPRPVQQGAQRSAPVPPQQRAQQGTARSAAPKVQPRGNQNANQQSRSRQPSSTARPNGNRNSSRSKSPQKRGRKH